MQSRAERDQAILQNLVAEFVQSRVELRVIPGTVLEDLSDLCAKIAFEKRSELRIDVFLELRFEFRGGQLVIFEVTGNKLGEHQAAIEETGEAIPCVR